MVRQHIGGIALPYRSFLHASLFHVRSCEAGLNIYTVGAHESLGEIISLQTSDSFRSDDSFGYRFDLSSHQIGIKALSQKLQGMGHTIRHIGGIPIRDMIYQTGCCRTGIDINKIMIIDEGCGILPDALFLLAHHKLSAADFLITRTRDLLLDRCCSTKNFSQFSFFIQNIKIPPNGRF